MAARPKGHFFTPRKYFRVQKILKVPKKDRTLDFEHPARCNQVPFCLVRGNQDSTYMSLFLNYVAAFGFYTSYAKRQYFGSDVHQQPVPRIEHILGTNHAVSDWVYEKPPTH